MPAGENSNGAAGTGGDVGSTTTHSIQTIFSIETFDPKSIKFQRWVNRLESAFEVFKVTQPMKKSYLLHYMGSEAYDVLCDKLSPLGPRDKSYDEIIQIMGNHYNPEPLEIAEVFRFLQRKQGEGETAEEYITALRKLAIHCNFGDYRDKSLRNQFVFGLQSTSIQSRMLEIKNLTVGKAVETATSMELSARNVAELQLNNNCHKVDTKFERNNVRVKSSNSYSKPLQNKRLYKQISNVNKFPSVGNTIKCYRCGGKHKANECSLPRSIQCNGCGVKGHLQRVCMRRKQQSTNLLDVEQDQEIENIFQLNHGEFRDKFKIDLDVDGHIIQFEIDTGAAVAVIGQRLFTSLFPDRVLIRSDLQLVSYCNNILKVLGYIKVKVTRGKTYELKLYVTDTEKPPLMGREWFRQMNFKIAGVNTIQEDSSSRGKKLRNILNEYSSIFDEELSKVKGIQVSLAVKQDTKPVFAKARVVPFKLIPAVEKEIEKLVQAGILEKIDRSDWATPIVPVLKNNAEVRLCGDFKITVNPHLIVDNHPLPTTDQLFAEMSGGKTFSKIDLRQAYLQLEVKTENRDLLTLNTHKGLYRGTRLLYDLASAPGIWQREFKKMLSGIQGVSVFMDDVNITGPTDEIHLQRLEEVFKRLKQYDIKVNLKKSEFCKDRIEYCGYEIDKDGIHKARSKVEAIDKMPKPKDVTEVRAFIGLVNYYGRFISNLSTILHPLNKLLRRDIKFVWDENCDTAFEEAKEAFKNDSCLARYDPQLSLTLSTDASAYGVGAVLSHVYPDGTEKAIQYASQTLTDTQKKYSQIDKEAYSIIFGVKKFYNYLFGNQFTLITDHKPLVHIFAPNKGLPIFSAMRMQHYAMYLQSFRYKIKYRKSNEHANADALSRLPIKINVPDRKDVVDSIEINLLNSLPITSDRIAVETEKDLDLKPILNTLSGKNSNFKKFGNIPISEFTIQSGCVLRGNRVVIPSIFRDAVLKELHEGHLGIKRMKQLARGLVWWPGIDEQLSKLVDKCENCCNVRNNPPKSKIHSWEHPRLPFERVHVDFAGPFLGLYYFVLVDAYTKWPEVHVMKNITAESTITICRQIFSTFGLPTILVSDNGPTFTSFEFQKFLKMNGILHKFTPAYHPQSNGLAERFVQTIKNALKKMATDKRNIPEILHRFLFQYRISTHSVTNKSPSELMFTRKMKSRLDLIKPISDRPNCHNGGGNSRFLVGSRVQTRSYDGISKWKFGNIIEKEGDLIRKVRLDDGRVWRRHIDQIRTTSVTVPREVTIKEKEESKKCDQKTSRFLPFCVTNANEQSGVSRSLGAETVSKRIHASRPREAVVVKRSTRVVKKPTRFADYVSR